MARYRTIKPEFFTSEQVVECSTTARLLFIGMWCFCDDGGVHPASLSRLKMEIFPADEITTTEVKMLVDELISHGLIESYVVTGKEFWRVTGWHHQKIERPRYTYPKSVEFGEQSTRIRRGLDDSSYPEQSRAEQSTTDTTDTTDHINKERNIRSVGQRKGGLGENKVAASDAEPIAAMLCRRAGYSGNDGAIFWKAAAAVHCGLLAEGIATSAAEGCAIKSPRNVPGYFRKCLVDADPEANAALRSVYLIPKCPKSVPIENSNGRIRPKVKRA